MLSVGEAVCSDDFKNYSIPCSCGEYMPTLTIQRGAVVNSFLGNSVSMNTAVQQLRSVKRKLNDI